MPTNADPIPATTPVVDEQEDKHGWFYWAARNTITGIWRFLMRHKIALAILGLVSLWFLLVFRAYWQPFIVLWRVHTPETVVLASLGWFIIVVFRKKMWKLFFVLGTVTTLLVLWHIKAELPPLRYLTLYVRYKSLDPVVLTELPTTDHERIQPLNSIRVLGREAMKEVERTNDPDFVRIKDEYRWTMAIEPAYAVPRTFGHVKEVLSVSGLSSSPNFGGENRVPVSFRVGEEMKWGKKTEVAVIRSFGLLRFLSYSPRDVKFVKDDNGEWVQVISLIRWRGFFFVWPEFGGVQVIKQGESNLLKTVRSWFAGDGEWIPPEDVHRYHYLEEQNTVPYEVSRYAATSLRFQNGFRSPMPWYHKGDIRIPNLEGDQNDQPFAVYFRFHEVTGSPVDDKLYHYFALEPYDSAKQGLNTSVFVPADGMGPTRIYRHYKINEALTGVSAIAAKVMEFRKSYDWEQSRPVEHRPWIRDLGGKRRFFWITSIVTYKDKGHMGNPEFIAGSTPEMTVTDATYKVVVGVDPHDPSKWEGEVAKALEAVWQGN